MLKKTWLTAALLATCSMANAAPYIGASIGKATFDDISGSIKSNTYNASEKLEVKDNESLSGKVFGGYTFNEYISLEGAIGGYDALDGSVVTVGDMKFLAIQPKLTLPIGDRFNLFAKAGLSYFNAEFKVSNSVLTGDEGHTTFSETTVTGLYGLGAEFAITKNLALQVEWEYMKPELDVAKLGSEKVTVEAEISAFSVGMSYRF
ncbi:outer membrane beta-barrel protein [Vibrio parahaemolyticus]|uniref:Outer membrane beta-barrel protein n=11 Tax=Vibrio TaxID=662 RepID=A0A0E2XRR3_VIBPH|nr:MULTISPECIES: outer membrane beta-barrel protein [Vibrio]EFO38982.1 outer membrane protein [Vibrio parahaemolyticus Peru-466]EFO46784.1 outer membrane protein [Vibrio parahaemolyticus AQ4037]EFO52490.1 outer membrane protein [Vibrio parahaemolyticus K5030]EJG0873696.1 outer membrane beta-barrel protein [Vibrio parahaemolyticus O3]EJG0902354.1 outer membrane beta-barrel protein [Vibrio parahaemolyticus O3:K56]EJG0920029.1 outer membrane beta-barrel protein [Vibrio parahaemolyticus O1:K68]E